MRLRRSLRDGIPVLLPLSPHAGRGPG
jgi:hypothetical protein